MRPRVFCDGSPLARLLEEEVAQALRDSRAQVLQLVGPMGSGKSTALAHLAAIFAGEERLQLFDEGHAAPRTLTGGATVWVVARRQPKPGAPALRIAPWTCDEAIEYLLGRADADIGAAIAAWRNAGDGWLGRWPALARRVLDLVAAGTVRDVQQALLFVLASELSVAEHAELRQLALQQCSAPASHATSSPDRRADAALPVPALRYMLAAEELVDRAECGRPCLSVKWSDGLILAVRAEVSAARLPRLAAMLELGHAPTALSVLCTAQPGYRPPGSRLRTIEGCRAVGADLRGFSIHKLRHADLSFANLRDADLVGASADGAVLRGALLQGVGGERLQGRGIVGHGMDATRAHLRHAVLSRSDFDGAVFAAANLSGAWLEDCVLQGAVLRGANLVSAWLLGARLHQADLRGADCAGAKLMGVDLRTAQLEGVRLDYADLRFVNLAGTTLPDLQARRANFGRADLSGARWRGANLAGAKLVDAALAEVDWQGAVLRDVDFRNATFHLGSSRCGHVGSPIAGEGSRTGFYTDESFEHAFRAPEDVRKANLCGADLRGAKVEGVDFYLVDLRGALLDAAQVPWLRRCRAILDRHFVA